MTIFAVLKGFYQDFHSLFSKQLNSTVRTKIKLFIRRTTRNLLSPFKTFNFLIKLTASLPVPVSFRCRPPRFRSETLILELSTMSHCNGNRYSFSLFTVSVTFPLSVLLTTFDIQTFD